MKTIPLSVAAAFALLTSASAGMLNGNLSWTGNAGWSVKSTFKIDGSRGEIHEYYGELDGPFTGLYEFKSVVYDPTGEEVFRTYEVDGFRNYWYMEFHLDVDSETLIAGMPFDIGEDPGYWIGHEAGSKGMYMAFAGEVEIEDDPGEFEYIEHMDIDEGPVSNLQISVPEGGAGFVLTGGCLLGLAAAGGRIRRLRSTDR